MSEEVCLNLSELSYADFNEISEDLAQQILENPILRFEVLDVSDGEQTKPYVLRSALVAFMFTRPFYHFENYFLSLDTFDYIYRILEHGEGTGKEIEQLLNWVIGEFNSEENLELNEVLALIIRQISDLGAAFNSVYGNSVSLQDIYELANKNSEFNDLLNFQIPPNLQFQEIETVIKKKVDKLVEIISNDGSVMSNLLNCGTAINVKQLGQALVCVGLKPDLYGRVIDEPINTSLLRGFRNTKDFYINAVGARKALITNFKQVRQSGYLARKLALMVIQTDSNSEETTCDTKHGVTIDIKDAEIFTRLIGRYTLDGDLLTKERADEFIGIKVTLRDPITCADEKVCSKCYGHLWKVNKNLHAGLIAVLLITERLTQRLLSTKHLLQTNTEKLDFCELFEKCFIVDRSNILANAASLDRVIINIDDVEEDELTGDKYVNKLKVVHRAKTHEIISDHRLFFTSETKGNIENVAFGETIIDPGQLDGPIFTVIVDNRELSESLHQILYLMERNNHLGCETIDELEQKFLELLNESDIKLHSTHVGMILRALISDTVDESERPNFLQPTFPDYKIQTVTSAILNLPLSVSLVFEEIKKQFRSISSFQKTKESILDGIFQ